ncbi:hypothetical protein ACQUJT_17085 [Ralstonia pseudosolanacearum]|uniref:Transmembrane protein n=1 Tax=Ralstonia solanacearum TaxID=305 RepID=A0AA92K5P6_RALSL|nr:hypothetical protein [Ralstonia pseudosolanacearum]CBJ39792.1 conserved exported protein of unknown function [Ralstonia solanacearum CMR15]QOK94106.1 hypothetical protein HF908_21945 [Ralstonia pseudosolanacearum]QOK98976.1 hypothetical protein HF909_21515 [Ralstonia pseudosolanacearum]UWD88070.1 hypothetical protein NY025_04880 [Ralstonia pseudosolanacearum]CAH0443149.1 hypothetical protein LMG9673_03948 [Ralstonia pseudosolanacearum]
MKHEMKTLLALLAATGFFAATGAQADTVAVTSVTNLSDPSTQSVVSKGVASFVGTKQIVLALAGKTCTWVGSASAIGPVGCNYGITVNGTNQLSNPESNSNPNCTPASQMIAMCK